MNPERVLRRIDAFQQHNRPLGFLFAVVKKFGDDRAGMLAALMSYYGFLALFPLLLLLVTILGFALRGNPSLQNRVLQSTLTDLPIIGDQLRTNIHSLRASPVATIVGAGGLLWGSLGVTQAAQFAMAQVWNVQGKDRPGFLTRLIRGLLFNDALALIFALPGGILGKSDGIVSATSTGNGGGLFDIRDAESSVTSTPIVSASIDGGTLRGRDIVLSANSGSNVGVSSAGAGGGFVSFGSATANANVTNTVTTSIASSASLFATRDIEVLASGVETANGEAIATVGGLIAAPTTSSTLQMGFQITNTVSGNLTVRLGADVATRFRLNTVSGTLQLDDQTILERGGRGLERGSGRLDRAERAHRPTDASSSHSVIEIRFQQGESTTSSY